MEYCGIKSHVFVRVRVKLMDRTEYSIEVRPEDTIWEFKEKIFIFLPPEDFKLIFHGKSLENDRTINDYRIQEGSTIYMVENLRGGGVDPICRREISRKYVGREISKSLFCCICCFRIFGFLTVDRRSIDIVPGIYDEEEEETIRLSKSSKKKLEKFEKKTFVSSGSIGIVRITNMSVIPISKVHIYVESHHNKFTETINEVSKENCVLLMQIDLFSDKNCSNKINNDSDYNIAVDRVIRDRSLKMYYKIKSKPSFSLSFVPINIDFEPFIIDCSGDCKSIIDRVSDQFKCPSHSLGYFTDREMSLQIENIDYFIRNCRQNSRIYFFVKFLVDDFVVIEGLGEGAFGRVYKCREIPSSKIVAAKQFTLSGGKPEKIFSFQRELEVIKLLKDHSRIIKFEGQRERNDAAYLLMEYAPNGSLGQYTKKNGALKENAIANYAKQILEGLQYLHNNNIVHGDIKGDNILLDNNCNIKLCDFGLSKSLVKMSAYDSLQRHINSLVGTVNWLAPEKICGEEYEFAADIWSFGATMIEMVTGHIPFYKYRCPATVMFKIGSLKQIEFEYSSNSDTTMKEFIDLCLQPDPRERAKIDRLFNHQFLIKGT